MYCRDTCSTDCCRHRVSVRDTGMAPCHWHQVENLPSQQGYPQQNMNMNMQSALRSNERTMVVVGRESDFPASKLLSKFAYSLWPHCCVFVLRKLHSHKSQSCSCLCLEALRQTWTRGTFADSSSSAVQACRCQPKRHASRRCGSGVSGGIHPARSISVGITASSTRT